MTLIRGKKKRIGRIRRGEKLGIIIPIEEEKEIASKGKGETREHGE